MLPFISRRIVKPSGDAASREDGGRKGAMEGGERFEGSATERMELRGCGSVRRARVLVLFAAAAASLCLLVVSGDEGMKVRRARGTRRVCARACGHTQVPARACGQGVREYAPVLACARSCMCVMLSACGFRV